MSASGTSTPLLRSLGGPAAVTLVAAGGLIFDALTPQVISVTAVYLGPVLLGYWLPQAVLALALLATLLIIIGHWVIRLRAHPGIAKLGEPLPLRRQCLADCVFRMARPRP